MRRQQSVERVKTAFAKVVPEKPVVATHEQLAREAQRKEIRLKKPKIGGRS